MHLRSLSLQNWKAFEQARFEFPSPTDRKNVILIGGKNGHGKTSLFEALALGLYGRDGLRLVQRAGPAANDERLTQSYRTLMSRAFNVQAASDGRNACKVAMVFESDDGDRIEVERTWYFTSGGELRQNDSETLRVLIGDVRRVIQPPRTEADPDGWWRDWIARAFLPANLAPFFLFDGEAASAYAESAMAQQVKEGIDGLLGLVWLRRLAQSLREYAADRRTQLPKGVNAEAIEKLEHEIGTISKQVTDAEARLKEIASDLARSEEERTKLTRDLAGYGGRTRADLEDLIKQRADEERDLLATRGRLSEIVEGDLPFALAGRALRTRLAARLEQEGKREQWLAAAAETRARAQSVLDRASEGFAGVAPPLTRPQVEKVREAIEKALETLWNPPPNDAADAFRHSHATGRVREAVRLRLDRAASVTAETITIILDAETRHAATLRALNDAIEAAEMTGENLEERTRRLAELNAEIEALRREEGEKAAIVASSGADLQQKRAELARLTERLDQSQRPARLAKRAEQVAGMLDALMEDARPLQTEAIASEMTRAIGAMAHKRDLFRRVEITRDGEVRLLGPAGRNLRDLDLSAGEKQIFTQSLFAAVAAVSERVFPLVIDTPLGRLDEEHRIGVLRFLAERAGQVILISTDTEVVGPYLDAIRGRVAKAWLLRNRTEGESGRSWVEPGYFEGQRI